MFDDDSTITDAGQEGVRCGLPLPSGVLSPREYEIADRLLAGEAMDSIADALGVKPATVRSTLHRVYRKLGVGGARELRDRYASGNVVSNIQKGIASEGIGNETPDRPGVLGIAADLPRWRVALLEACVPLFCLSLMLRILWLGFPLSCFWDPLARCLPPLL